MALAPTEDFWCKLEFELTELRDLFYMRLETKQEGVGTRVQARKPVKGRKTEWRDGSPRWLDESTGQWVRPWLLIPYVKALDQELLLDQLEAGKNLLQKVEEQVSARELSVDLLHQWGLLNRWGGAIQTAYFAKPDVGRLREASENLAGQKRWFSHQFLKAKGPHPRSVTIDKLEDFINSVVKRVKGPERDWFMRFLSELESDSRENAHKLTKAFTQELSIADMQNLDQQSWEAVPEFAQLISYP